MNLLVIGGTLFLGRHLVEAALRAGHSVTLFHRGKTNPDLFSEVERVIGDRDGDLGRLDGRRFDAVVDTCGYYPRVVRASASFFAERADHYTFVSSVSVYAAFREPDQDESAPVGTLEDPTVERIDGETYGPLKALCERAAEEAMPDRTLVVRPGLIVGPYDPTDRFAYWVRRIARGGEVLAPGRPERPVEFIDARDVASWMLAAVERGTTGVYNATGPEKPMSMGEFLDACLAVTSADAHVEWVDEAFLLERGVQPWVEVPMWVPESDPDSVGLFSIDHSKAERDGLRYRSAVETIGDTSAWVARGLPYGKPSPALTPEREAELLAAWHART